VAENAALSFGDDLPGGEISELDREHAIRDWMDVSLNAAVACTAATWPPTLPTSSAPSPRPRWSYTAITTYSRRWRRAGGRPRP